MNTDVLEAAGIAYQEGLQRCLGNHALYQRMLGKFLEDTSMEQAAQHLAAREYPQIFQYLHNLKGVSGNLSMTGLHQVCTDLVAQLRQENYAGLEEQFALLDGEYRKICAAIACAQK